MYNSLYAMGVGTAPRALKVSTWARFSGVLIFNPLTSSGELMGRLLLVIFRKPFS